MARATDLPKSTVLRLLASLEDLGVVERIEGRYVLGNGLRELTRHTSPASSLRSVARPYLTELSEKYGENASLAIRDGDELLYIDTALAETESGVQVSDWTGHQVPFHADAAGLVIMSSWSDDDIVQYAATGLDAPTERTITGRDELLERAALIRSEGVAWTYGEFSEDVDGVEEGLVDPGTFSRAVPFVKGGEHRRRAAPGSQDVRYLDEQPGKHNVSSAGTKNIAPRA